MGLCCSQQLMKFCLRIYYIYAKAPQKCSELEQVVEELRISCF